MLDCCESLARDSVIVRLTEVITAEVAATGQPRIGLTYEDLACLVVTTPDEIGKALRLLDTRGVIARHTHQHGFVVRADTPRCVASAHG